jgi:hypothetical protein
MKEVSKMRRAKCRRLSVGTIVPLVLAILPLLLTTCGDNCVCPTADTTPVAKTLWDEDFSSFEASLYYVSGSAYWDSTHEYFVLTPLVLRETGRIFLLNEQLMDQWCVEFDLRTGGGMGADGLTFAFCRIYDYPPKYGVGIDFWNADGYAVEFDTYFNPSNLVADPTRKDHVAVVKDSVSNHMVYAEIPDIEDNSWHHVSIVFDGGMIRVGLDETERIAYEIPEYDAFTGYFGFTAGTGAYDNWHIIDNIHLTKKTVD